MIFSKTEIPGAVLIKPEQISDDRGHFARTWCQKEFAEHGLNERLVQCSTSFNVKAGTLRGIHYQMPPHMEAKLVRCTRGALFDVIVDLREGSETFGRWAGFELSGDNGYSIYIPEGVAHGFQTLIAETEVFYQISTHYVSSGGAGISWDDPDLAIDWPEVDDRVISEADSRRPRLATIEPLPNGTVKKTIQAAA